MSLDILDNGTGGEYETATPLDGAVEDYASPPKPDSPRTVWFRENRAMLSKKEDEEKEAKEELMSKAKEYISEFYAERKERIEKKKKVNREDELKAQELKERPEGSDWKQIIDLIDFNQGVQQKDVSRCRSLLFQAKDVNLSVQETQNLI